ncbi:MAG: hypothetical protein WB661_12920 [Candidatus Bathyarchaeia archaeon]
MALKIRPVRLKQTVYLRIPNDIADLIGIQPNAELTLNLKELQDTFLLTYSVAKSEQREPRRQAITVQP